MTIDKAIEILQHGADVWNDAACPGTAAALKMGIEALKAVEKMRHEEVSDEILPLPGETEE